MRVMTSSEPAEIMIHRQARAFIGEDEALLDELLNGAWNLGDCLFLAEARALLGLTRELCWTLH